MKNDQNCNLIWRLDVSATKAIEDLIRELEGVQGWKFEIRCRAEHGIAKEELDFLVEL